MQIVIDIDRRSLAGLAAVLGLAGALQWAMRPDGAAQASQVGALTTFTAGTTISAGEVNGNFTALRTAVDDNDSRIAALEALLASVSFDGATDTWIFTGVNVQVRNGAGATGTKDGTGNLIVGHNVDDNLDRSGSHNLVIGDEIQYAATGSLAVGTGHDIDGAGSVVLGGQQNRVTAARGAIVGGQLCFVDGGLDGAIVGGRRNGIEDGGQGVVVGGQNGIIAADPNEANTDGNRTVFVGLNFADGAPVRTGGNHRTELASGPLVLGAGLGNFMAAGASLDLALAATRVLIGDPTDPTGTIEMVTTQQLLVHAQGGVLDVANTGGNVAIRAPSNEVNITDSDGGLSP